jgi:ATP-dependent Clp protease protease subunit
MRRFWNWIRNSAGTRTLYIDGPIAEESWWGDEVTPAMFREELNNGSGPINVYIHSPGGDCFAASQIYTMLMDYPSEVNVTVDGLAASAASVIAMAGTTVRMAPTAMLMIHNPATVAMGQVAEMQQAINILNEVKESIINAYQIKTGMSRNRISRMMDEETWMNAKKALELGFCDEIISKSEDEEDEYIPFAFGQHAVEACFANSLKNHYKRLGMSGTMNVVASCDVEAVDVDNTSPDVSPAEPETSAVDEESTSNVEDETTVDETQPSESDANQVNASDYDKKLQLLKYI